MLVTDAGRLIRVPADQVRITARQTMGVTLFRLGATERVTSVFPVIEDAVLEEPQGDEDLPAPPDLPPEA
jgi:DNA gyrase subunit A